MEVAAAPAPQAATPASPKLVARRSYPACNVCKTDLRSCRSFHQRYHVCPEHATADSVQYEGVLQRFCQQCGRFHELDRFDQGMRSCRAQLARHAERRRKRRAEASAIKARFRSAEEAPKPGPPPAPAAMRMVQPLVLPLPAHSPAPPALPFADFLPGKRQRLDGMAPQLLLAEQMPRLPARLVSHPAPGGDSERPGSGAGKQDGSGSASMQSTHSTQRQHSSQGLDALLAAAEEEEGGALAKQRNSVPLASALDLTTADLSWLMGPPQLSASAQLEALPPMPLPLGFKQEGAGQPLLAPPVFQREPPPLPPQFQQPPPRQAQGWDWQPQAQWPAPAPQPSAWLPAAPQPAPVQSQAQLVQLLQHLASPSAAAALAALGQQLAAPPPPPPPPVQQQAPQLDFSSAAATIQAAMAELAHQQEAQQQQQQQQEGGMQHLLQLLGQQGPEQKAAQLQQMLRLLVQG